MRAGLVVTMLLTMLVGVAQADTRAHEDEELARFQRYAGAPIEAFPMFEMWQWQVVGPERLVVWSTIHDAYLIRVDKPCIRLEWTHALRVTQQMRQKVSSKFDFVVFEDQRCKIVEILPIDYKSMLKDGKAKPPGPDAPPKSPDSQASGGT